MSAILPLLVDGLAEAALIFFVAVGLTLVFSVLRILNVAHGSFYSIGAYVAVLLGTWIVGRGFAPVLTLLSMVVAAALVAVVLGPAIERTFIRWTYGRPGPGGNRAVAEQQIEGDAHNDRGSGGRNNE